MKQYFKTVTGVFKAHYRLFTDALRILPVVSVVLICSGAWLSVRVQVIQYRFIVHFLIMFVSMTNKIVKICLV